MQLQATGKAIRYRLKTGEEIVLHPGVPAEVPDRAARELLIKAPDRVRVVGSVTPDFIVESVRCRPLYWETQAGVIVGPASASLIARTTDDPPSFWFCLESEQTWRWINAMLVRSQEAFDRQSACNCCGGIEFWYSIHGVHVCSKCHPPADASLVQPNSRRGEHGERRG